MRSWSVIIILAVSQFVMVLDSTVMNVSISVVAEDLNTSITGMQAAITFYALTMAALMLTGGKLGDLMGRARAFKIGAVIYGIGSLTTALSPNLTVLMLGWSLVEGLGAVLVIPAIASLAAINYTGKARVTAFSILGAVTGLAAAVGPLLGGLMTTYASWRYVFVAETVVMVIVLFAARLIHDVDRDPDVRIDPLSVLASAGGLALIVYGVLQSKTWGWLKPQHPPEINGSEIAPPLGVSPVAYLLLIGVVVLWLFVDRQRALARSGRQPLLRVELLRVPALRSGLGGFLAQYFAIAALFFVVPVYLQTMLGRDALQTGVKILPLSVGLVLFSVLGSWLTARRSARFIARGGQLTMAVGVLFVIAGGVGGVDLRSIAFAIGMFVMGAGFGLLASQLGNVNMSAVEEKDTSEVGGLQGTFQNLARPSGPRSPVRCSSCCCHQVSSPRSTTPIHSPPPSNNRSSRRSTTVECPSSRRIRPAPWCSTPAARKHRRRRCPTPTPTRRSRRSSRRCSSCSSCWCWRCCPRGTCRTGSSHRAPARTRKTTRKTRPPEGTQPRATTFFAMVASVCLMA